MNCISIVALVAIVFNRPFRWILSGNCFEVDVARETKSEDGIVELETEGKEAAFE